MGDTIFSAIYGGDLPRVRQFLQDPDFDINITNNSGKSPLRYACKGRQSAIVKLLLEDPRVDVNLVDGNGHLPYSNLKYQDDLPCLKWLMPCETAS